MPSGVYVRIKPNSQKQRKVARKNMKKAQKIAWKLPRSLAQMEHAYKLRLNNIGKLHPHKATVFGNDTVKHHNDLCHGKLRPNDISLMTLSEHISLHHKLRAKNGTNPFLAINRKRWKKSNKAITADPVGS